MNPHRVASPHQTALANSLGSPNPAWITYWHDAGFTDDEVREWWAVTVHALHSFDPDWAHRLNHMGWSPGQVTAAQNGASVTMPHLDPKRPVIYGSADLPPITDLREGDPGRLAALALAQYLVEVAYRKARSVSSCRDNMLADLDRIGCPATVSAQASGLSKQRVGAILKSRRRGFGKTPRNTLDEP